jgi:ABC-type branched-subunit amino acid transport system substrate-binding protein
MSYRTVRRGRRTSPWASRVRSACVTVSIIAGAAGIAACGSTANSQGGGGSASGKASGGSLTVAIFQPFSGADAEYGAVGDAGVIPAVQSINAAGGVLGHKLAWRNVDTRGDPADAVPAANQLLATANNLVMTVGPTSDEASATVPIFNAHGVPMNIASGQVLFNKNKYAYVWRNTPPDNGEGAAIAYYARDVAHYARAAAVFGTDIASQGAEPSSIAVFKGLGGQIVATENVALNETSYETEVAKVSAAHPQVIFTEIDPQSSATFFGELANAGGLVPFLGTDGTSGPPYIQAVSKVVGKANFARLYRIVQFGAPPSAAANLYNAALLKYPSGISRPVSQWLNSAYALSEWDFVNSAALAMLESHSVNPRVFNAYIPRVTAPSPGAVVVDSFAAGAAALKAGKPIQYVGGLGTTIYDQYHNSAGTFLAQASDQSTILHVIPGTIVTRLITEFGG